MKYLHTKVITLECQLKGLQNNMQKYRSVQTQVSRCHRCSGENFTEKDEGLKKCAITCMFGQGDDVMNKLTMKIDWFPWGSSLCSGQGVLCVTTERGCTW